MPKCTTRVSWIRKPHKLNMSVGEIRAFKYRLIMWSLKNGMVQIEISVDNGLSAFKNGTRAVESRYLFHILQRVPHCSKWSCSRFSRQNPCRPGKLGLGLWRHCWNYKIQQCCSFFGTFHLCTKQTSCDLGPEEQHKLCGCLWSYFSSEPKSVFLFPFPPFVF